MSTAPPEGAPGDDAGRDAGDVDVRPAGAGPDVRPAGAGPDAVRPAGAGPDGVDHDAPVRPTVGERLRAVPLGARMVAILCAVLLVGLTVTGATALTLLRRNLVQQVDEQILTYARPLVRKATGFDSRGPGGGGDDRLPSDYYVEIVDAAGSTVGEPVRADTSSAGAPRLPDLGRAEVLDRGQHPFTVTSTQGPTDWRAIVLPAEDEFGEYAGAVAIALPLTGVEKTLADMRKAIVLTGLAVIALGSVAGWVAVRRSLRPLQEMEATAGAIAAGDLTRRVPPRPTTTEVGRLSAALNAMLGHIERAFSARAASEDRMRRFVADASHELRTPLATIRGYGELYRMGALTTPQQVDDTVRRIEESATRMGRLVEDLLALARLDEGRPLRTEAVDLTVVAADALSDLRALDRTRSVRITPVPEGAELGACVVVGDEDRLRQVLANLTGNVVQHTPPGTAVEIAVGRHSPGWALVEVRDHGPGIAPEHAARVFERFYRVDASRTRESGGGAGLGMAIVAAIVEAHHGRVELAPTPGGGTTVRVWLPTSAVPLGHGDTDTGPARADAGAAVAPSRGDGGHPGTGTPIGAAAGAADARSGRPAGGAADVGVEALPVEHRA
ncbi:sensor histidine kinase [Cellulomonas aerilata]|uniref:histidine kinase n=1 Tax=Cellulomonas aerilata TaxID=515326 RepID=A0A512DF28_9CELL|nr:HAMP domain-containing sensor histidine kinase [Cellulomonas aerilata]GEO34840.1 two-component sensor histidine kinase [Cellulomonas aerilata]